MTKSLQKTILTDLCDGLKRYPLSKIDDVPENWDGTELRLWVRDAADEQIAYSSNVSRARMRDYGNDRLTLDL